ncbi:MAG: hypothetical protein DME21_17755 [Verrucomicrobia bacterium]|nr:MAG: hypothetical protein DME21_17755 [Verrucomicrobiota bacterium]
MKKEWYKLGTDFSIGAGDNETTISLAGLDENFAASWALLIDLLTGPTAEPGTLEELKKIILVQREDAKKDFRTLTSAVAQYNRYGADSPFLRALPNDKLTALTLDDLHGLIKSLLTYRHAITYTGSSPMGKVEAILKQRPSSGEPLKPTPPYKFLRVAAPGESRVYLFDKEMAQSQVRIEFGDGEYNEANVPPVQLFNDYFSGGMSGIVFQELREARALAYSAYAVYSNGGRKDEQNVMVGGISCQADKTSEALDAFMDLFENLPTSPERFRETRDSVISRYRTGKIGFREILGSVRSWERLEVPIDPRKERFAKVRQLGLDQVVQFQKQHLKGRPRLISIVGDRKKFDLERLKKAGAITELQLKDIFVF